MLRPNIKNIILFFLVKYLLFYFLIMFKNKNFKLFELDNIKEGHSLSYFLLVMLPLPAICIVFFSAPIYYSFKLKQIFRLVLLGLIFVAEYFLYVALTSDKHIDINGVFNLLISLLVFVLLFFRSVTAYPKPTD